MDKSRFSWLVLIGAAIVAELAAIVIIAKSIARDTSPTRGIVFLCVGMVMLVFALARKPGKAG